MGHPTPPKAESLFGQCSLVTFRHEPTHEVASTVAIIAASFLLRELAYTQLP